MKEPIQDPITGKEKPDDPGSAFAALVQFYSAFNSRDMNAMSENWHQSPDISMDNPLGGIKRGWQEVSRVYGRIFGGPARVYVEFFDYTIHEYEDVFYAVGRERGRFEKDGLVIDLAIRTSRVFRMTLGGWKQVHHHGSIEDPALLEEYQKAVSGS
jgi:ketosteroid isomerase-like protein